MYNEYDFKSLAKNKTILIVEDEPLTADYIEGSLTGFKSISKCKNGLDALKMATENRYDIIISDIYMPKMDGVEFSTKIKDRYPNQPIVIISTSEDARHLIKLIDIGVDSFLLKPVESDEIIKKVTKVLMTIKQKEDIKRIEFEEMMRKLGNKKYQDSKEGTKEEYLKNISEDEWLNFKRYQDDSMFLIDDFEKLINKILNNEIDYFILEDISDVLNDLFKIFSIVEDFKGLAKQLLHLSQILDTINLESMQDDNRKNFDMLECILEDIRTYIFDVFIDEKISNTDYFEKSLEYNINTFESLIEGKKEESGQIMFL
jgi:YesN/AraC family two-component response regulator